MRLRVLLTFFLSCALCATADQPTRLSVDGDTVTILRDAFGVPHILASTRRGLFFGNGYAIAQDRLWQMERYRRDAWGRLAELEGKEAVNRDKDTRRLGYTGAELTALFAAGSEEVKAIFQAYADGVNAYMREAEAAGRLPEPFQQHNLKPAPWTVEDSTAIGVMMAHRFGSGGGGELRNLRLFDKLREKFGEVEARKVFDDFFWLNDPKSPTTISNQDMRPPSGARGQAVGIKGQVLPRVGDPAALDRAAAIAGQESVLAYAAEHNLPTKFGSYAWLVAPKRSVSGNALLVGGPQMGFSTPQIAHEVHLSGAGYNVIGMGFGGIPGVLIGSNDDLAWTSTSGITDLVDIFAEKIDPANKYRYLHKGQWREMERREEIIEVRGGQPVKIEVARTVHGPVLEWDEKAGMAYAISAPFRGHETDGTEAFLSFNRAKNVEEFGRYASKIWLSHNFFVATRSGDIAYWHAGRPPVRAPGLDPRFPLPGTGEGDWKGVVPFERMPQVVNPPHGLIVNWNNKPAPWWDNGDRPAWGEIFRIHRINKLIEAEPKLTVEHMRGIIADIGLNDPNADYLKPHALQAVERVKPGDPELQRAAEYLRAWNNHAEEESVAKTILDAWLPALRDRLFKDDFKEILDSQDRGLYGQLLQPSLILHVLDGPKSGVPPKHDFLKGRAREQVIVDALRDAVVSLSKKNGPIMADWGYRGSMINFKPLPPIPATNRGTYIQIVELSSPVIHGVNILPPGQSEDPRSPHFADQRELAGWWRFKPMIYTREGVMKAAEAARATPAGN